MPPTDENTRRSSIRSTFPLELSTSIAVNLLVLFLVDLLIGGWSRSVVLLLAGALVPVVAAALFSMEAIDSRARRRRAARRLDEVATSAKKAAIADDTKGTDRALYLLKHTALHERRFDSCYAITLLGDLTSELSVRQDLVSTIADCLTRDDPFIRHAAAATLYRLGTRAAPARDRLARTAEQFPDESAAEFAKRVLRSLSSG